MKYFIFTLIWITVSSCTFQENKAESLKNLPEAKEVVQPSNPSENNTNQSQENNF